MSKFIDKLISTAQAGPQPIGFRAVQAATEKHRIQLVALVAGDASPNEVAAADAALLRSPDVASVTAVLKQAARAAPEIPWGIWPEDSGAVEPKRIAEVGCDFAVLASAGSAILTGPDDTVGIIVQIDTSISEALVRTINELPSDAALVTTGDEWQGPLTWQHLMLLQRFASLVTKPLLLVIRPGTSADELQLIWEAGIDAVVAAAGGDQSGEIARLRQLIDALETPGHRKHPRMEARVPRVAPQAEPVTEIEEPDDDD